MQNTSGIIPFEFNVLVTFDEAHEDAGDGLRKTEGGVFLMAESQNREDQRAMEATVVDVSPVAFTYAEWPEGTIFPKAGDRILFTRHAGAVLDGEDGNKYRILKDKDIAAIKKNGNGHDE